MKILLVEDSEEQQQAFTDSVEVFNRKNKPSCIKCEIAKNTSDALDEIDGSYDGAIIDLKLGICDQGGNEVVSELKESLFRIPVIFVTAFPGDVIEHPSIIKKRRRDDGSYEDDLLLFQGIKNTGLTNIMGGRGKIEDALTEVFLRNLLPQRDTWIEYGRKDSPRTEKALLRYALNHLLQLLEDDEEKCYPEEVYLYPPLTDEIRTGSIVEDKNEGMPFAVMNPACDLVVRDSGRKTDRILVAEVDAMEMLFPWCNDKNLNNTKKSTLKKMFQNTGSDYWHWLPRTDFFKGGFLNFRKLTALEIGEFEEKFDTPQIQISPSFVRDITARFSSYYARQGQPDIDFSKFVDS